MSDKRDEHDFLVEDIREVKQALNRLSDQANDIDKSLSAYKTSFDNHIIQDEKMYEEFKRLNDILMENTLSLKEHMHRTGLLEQAVIKMDSRLSPIEIDRIKKQAINSWIKSNLYLVAKVVGAITALAGLYKAIAMFIH